MPAVTVLLAVRDGERYVREAIESVLGQSFRDIELLVVDDGSTDGTREILRGCLDERVRLVANDRNLGLAKSLNRGLASARGRYVARLDADDVCEPERLAKQLAFLDESPGVALVGSAYREIDAHGSVLRERSLPTEHAELCWALLFYCPFAHSAVMLRKEAVLREVGCFDESLGYAMDYELWRRIARRFRVANLRDSLVRYRVHPESMTGAGDARTREGRTLAEETLGELLGWAEPDRARRFDVLRALATEAPLRLEVEEVRWGRSELRRLYSLFCDRLGVTESERSAGAKALRRTMARQLCDIVRLFSASYPAPAAARLLAAAVRAHPGAVAERSAVEAVAQLVRSRFAAQRRSGLRR